MCTACLQGSHRISRHRTDRQSGAEFGACAFTKTYRWTWRRQWQPTPVLLPGESQGRRSLVGCSPWGCEELDMTERLHFPFSLSCIGEGNGNPLQCSCLENPRDGGAWWAAVYGVAQSRTRLKRLSSSSSTVECFEVLWLKLNCSIQPRQKRGFSVNFQGSLF